MTEGKGGIQGRRGCWQYQITRRPKTKEKSKKDSQVKRGMPDHPGEMKKKKNDRRTGKAILKPMA